VLPIYRDDEMVGWISMSNAGLTIVSDDDELKSHARLLRPEDSLEKFVFVLSPKFSVVLDESVMDLQEVKPVEPTMFLRRQPKGFLVFLKDGVLVDILSLFSGEFQFGKLAEEFSQIKQFIFGPEDRVVSRSLFEACVEGLIEDIVLTANEKGYDVLPISMFHWEVLGKRRL